MKKRKKEKFVVYCEDKLDTDYGYLYQSSISNISFCDHGIVLDSYMTGFDGNFYRPVMIYGKTYKNGVVKVDKIEEELYKILVEILR